VTAFPSAIALGDETLRAWAPGDESALAAALLESDAHLRRWTPWVVDGKVPGQSLAERLARHAAAFDAGDEWVYGIFAADGAVLGGCGLYPRIGPGAVELGYWLAARATGRGLATRASAELVRLAFAMPSVERVEIRCDPANVASARVPQRLGFTLTPVRHEGLQVWELAAERG
jgi:RimJ/RimL family protein N-acetyltransferase